MAHQLWRRFEAVAARRGNAPAVLHGEQIASFAALRERAAAWARRLSLAPGERAVLCADNSSGVAAAVLGLWARGAVPVIVSEQAPQTHRERAARATAAKLAVTDTARASGAWPVPVLDLTEVDRDRCAGSAPPTVAQSAAEPGSILFTSGSTGPPKGVVQSAANLLDGVDRVAAATRYRADDRILCSVPFAFDYGWGQLLSTLLGGYTLVLPEPRNSFGLCAAIGRHRPSVLALVPSVLGDLFAGLAPIRDVDQASVRLITNTGAKIAPRLFETMLELFPAAAIGLNYGLTETYRSAMLPTSLARNMRDSVGFALPGVDLAVLRPDGTRCAPGEEGEIVHRGAGTFLGYWGEPERTAAVRRPDPLWRYPGVPAPAVVFTGDLGRVDERGALYVHGRRDRQLKSMGVRVSPDEVEAVLAASGCVDEVAIVARPHDLLGDMIVAAVRLAPRGDGADPLAALKRYANDALSPYMRPRAYLTMETLPRTTTGKVDYPKLAAWAREAATGGGR